MSSLTNSSPPTQAELLQLREMLEAMTKRTTGATDGHQRASDAERDAVADALARMRAIGRISLEEHAARVEAVLRAKSLDEMREQVADLPLDLVSPPREQIVAHAPKLARTPAQDAFNPPTYGGGGGSLEYIVIMGAGAILVFLALQLFGVDVAETVRGVAGSFGVEMEPPQEPKP